MSRQGFDIVSKYPMVSSKEMQALSKEIVFQCRELFVAGKIDSAVIFYNHYVSMVKQEVLVSELFPVVFDDMVYPDHIPLKCDAIFGETGYDFELPEYIYLPGKRELLKALLMHYMESKLLNVMLESASGENSSRVIAMQQATVNADEMIAELTLQYNKARQEIITNQIIEITSSAEALN
jgi:F-type H+-transporting ATPase subunit gamma